MPITRSYVNAFEVVDYTQDLISVPNEWNLINRLGIFGTEGVSNHTVTFEASSGTIGLITDQVRGYRAQMNSDESRALRSFAIPHFNLDDAVKPQDIQGKKAFGSTDAAETEAAVIARKMLRIRRSYSALLEASRAYAITTGGIYAPNGTVVGNMYTEFGVTRKEVDFALGTSTTEIISKIEEGIASIQDNMVSGESLSGFVVLTSPQFFAKLIAHATVKEAFKYYTSTQSPLRERLGTGVEREFMFGGVTFIEYRGVNPQGAQYIPSGDAYLIPTGTFDTFKTYFSPANKFDYINTMGQEVYMFSYRDPKGSEITIETESNMLNMVRRPQAIVRFFTSN